MAEKIKVTCDNCGKPIYQYKARVEKYKHHFCDGACYGKWRSENIIGEKNPVWKPKINCICLQCNKEFKISPSIKRGKRFCSRECYGKWKSENIIGEKAPRWAGGKVERTCQQCGKKFKAFPSKIKIGRSKFCSSRCYYKAQGGRTNRICKYCGKRFSVDNNVVKKGRGNYCSVSCARRSQKIPKHHTKPELIFEQICKNNNLPFKYTGDGSFWIKNINPDFVEVNGKKIAVEIFGDYWHSPLLRSNIPYERTYKGRKKILKKYGWELIILWSIDLIRKDAEQFVLNELRKNEIIFERIYER